VVSCRSRRERCRCHGKSGMEESRPSSAWSKGNKRWRCGERAVEEVGATAGKVASLQMCARMRGGRYYRSRVCV
jgi:hypothetical protein